MKRKNKARKVELSLHQNELFDQLTSEMMTDEESDEDSSSFVARKLTWRIEEIDELIHFLDKIPSDGNALQKPRRLNQGSFRINFVTKYFFVFLMKVIMS